MDFFVCDFIFFVYIPFHWRKFFLSQWESGTQSLTTDTINKSSLCHKTLQKWHFSLIFDTLCWKIPRISAFCSETQKNNQRLRLSQGAKFRYFLHQIHLGKSVFLPQSVACFVRMLEFVEYSLQVVISQEYGWPCVKRILFDYFA